MSQKVSEFYQEGKKYFDRQDYENALISFRKAIENKEVNEDLYMSGARSARALNLLTDSVLILEKGIELIPGSATIWSEYGVSFFHLGDKSKALECMNKAVELDAENSYRYSSRAYIRANMGDTGGAIEDYNTAVELDPNDEIAFNNLGLLQEKLGYQQEAQNSFRKSDELLKKKGEGPLIERKESDQDHLSEPINSAEANDKSPKLTLGFYFKTVGKVFTDKSERKQLVRFLKGKNGKK